MISPQMMAFRASSAECMAKSDSSLWGVSSDGGATGSFGGVSIVELFIND